MRPPHVGWLVVLSLSVAILLAGASAVFTVQAGRKIRRAEYAIARADSLVNEWVSRGCAPRTKSVP